MDDSKADKTFCTHCGGELQSGFAFCPHCGKPGPGRTSEQAVSKPAPVIETFERNFEELKKRRTEAAARPKRAPVSNWYYVFLVIFTIAALGAMFVIYRNVIGRMTNQN